MWAGGRGKLLALIAVPWGLLVGARMVYPVLLPDIQAEFDLSLTAAGLLITLLWFGAAVGQFPGGLLADRFSEHRIMAVSVLTVAVALALIVLAPVAGVLFVATLCWALGHSLYPIARITILTDIYPDRIGSALGVTMATGDLGQTIFPPIAGILAGILVWQMGLSFFIPLLVIAAVLIWLLLAGKSAANDQRETFSVDNARYILSQVRQPGIVFTGIILFFFSFMWQSFTAFYPTYLINEKGLTSFMAAVLFGLFFGLGVVVKPVSGMIYDRIGMRWSLISALVGPVVGLSLLPVVTGRVALTVITLLVSTMLGTGAITQSYLADMLPRDIRGSGLGTIRSTVFTLGSMGPVIFGALADFGYFDEAYLVLAAFIVIIILLTFRMPES